MKRLVFAVLIVLTLAVPAFAARTIIDVTPLDQNDFLQFSRDFGMALSYQPLSPAAPLGDKLPGIDAGVEVSYVKLDKSARWYTRMDSFDKATNTGELPNALYIPRVHVQFGFPVVPIDIGVSFAKVPQSDIKVTGYELKYALLSGGVATPAVALRAAYTKLSGVDTLDLSTKSLDISISKGIAIFTPYGGVGMVWITSEPNNKPTVPIEAQLQEENIHKPKGFVGVKTKIFPFLNLVLEGAFSNIREYSARLNASF